MHCWARTVFTLVVLVLGTLSMMSACGRKGPLYLPTEPAGTPPATQSDVPAPVTPEGSEPPMARP